MRWRRSSPIRRRSDWCTPTTATGEFDGLDHEVIARFAVGLSGVLDRAVLRHTLELHRAELSAAAQWMAGAVHRLEQLTDRST